MAGQTPNFGFNYFGGDVTGSFGDDNDKFAGEDRLTLDRVLAALASHSHHVTATIPEPADELDIELDPTGGQLAAGETYHYLISFVGPDGLETITGPEASIDTPTLLPAPDAPAANTPDAEDTTTTGTLPLGQYFYALTALRGTEESAIGDPVTLTVVDDNSAVIITLPDLDDAEEYQVWRMKDTDADYTRIGRTDEATFVDDGSVPSGVYGDPANLVPLVNTGVDNYAVKVELGDDDKAKLTAGGISAWRIYRSEFSGIYSAQSLVHEVIETTDPEDDTTPLLTSWIDDGDPLLIGSPKPRSQALEVNPFTFEHFDPLPNVALYPEYYAVFGPDNAMYVNVAGVWTPATAGEVTFNPRGVAFYTGNGAPTVEPTDAQAGDMYLDLDTGDLYELAGT